MFDDSLGLTKAVLDGHKTMTRRLVPAGTILKYDLNVFSLDARRQSVIQAAPFKVGDVLAVAQNYQTAIREKNLSSSQEDEISMAILTGHKGCANKMFVKAWLMPHKIRITDVNLERLQEITGDDCLKEGVQVVESTGCIRESFYPCPRLLRARDEIGWGRCYSTPREAFSMLIDLACGDGTWDKNPWVYVFEFVLIN